MPYLNSQEAVQTWLGGLGMQPGLLLSSDGTEYPYSEIVRWGISRKGPDTPLRRRVWEETGPYAFGLLVRFSGEHAVFGVVKDPETNRVYVEDCGSYTNPKDAEEVLNGITRNSLRIAKGN